MSLLASILESQAYTRRLGQPNVKVYSTLDAHQTLLDCDMLF